jgi:hypothetical protein
MSETRGGFGRPRVHTTWPPRGQFRRIVLGMAALTAAIGTIMVVSAGNGASAAPGGGGAEKYYVCKYVDKPGENEVLQTGQNPIVVDANAIAEDPVVVGSFFNDQHGRSYVLAAYPQDPEPTRDQCPQSTPSSEPPPSSPPASIPESTPPASTPVSSTPASPSLSISASSAHRTTAVATSSAPIPAGVSAGLHTPIANAGLRAWGTVLMLFGGAAGLLAGLWPTRRRVH